MTFPRFVHRPDGAFTSVANAEAYALALADGWSADPLAIRVEKDGEAHDVFTAEALAVALDQGWTRVVTPTPKKGRK